MVSLERFSKSLMLKFFLLLFYFNAEDYSYDNSTDKHCKEMDILKKAHAFLFRVIWLPPHLSLSATIASSLSLSLSISTVCLTGYTMYTILYCTYSLLTQADRREGWTQIKNDSKKEWDASKYHTL